MTPSLTEAVARAIRDAENGIDHDRWIVNIETYAEDKAHRDEHIDKIVASITQAALAAIEAAGFVVVPREQWRPPTETWPCTRCGIERTVICRCASDQCPPIVAVQHAGE